MSKRANEVWGVNSAKQTDARLRAVGELRGGDFHIGGKVMPAHAARKICQSTPTNTKPESLARALSCWTPAEPKKPYEKWSPHQ